MIPLLPAPSLGIDIGGSKTQAVLLDEQARIVADHVRPTEVGSDGVIATALAAAGATPAIGSRGGGEGPLEGYLSRVPLPQPAATAVRATVHQNREAAGQRTGRTLRLELDVVESAWRPEGANDPEVPILAFAERGKSPSVPGPLVRVPVGTTVMLSLRNRADSAIVIGGLRPGTDAARDTVQTAAPAYPWSNRTPSRAIASKAAMYLALSGRDPSSRLLPITSSTSISTPISSSASSFSWVALRTIMSTSCGWSVCARRRRLAKWDAMAHFRRF